MTRSITAEARYRIGMVAKLSGVSAHTIRMWERRYAAVVPARTEAGGRLYNDGHVGRLRNLRLLVESGHSIGRIAGLDDAELVAMKAAQAGLAAGAPAADGAGADPEASVSQFLEALSVGNLRGAEATLKEVTGQLPPRRLIREVLLPIQQEVGRRWHVGELRVAHEHAATQLLRNVLGALTSSAGTPIGAPVAIACTPAGQRHELGAHLAGLIAALNGYHVVHLGGDLPVEEILHAVGENEAVMVLLSIAMDDSTSVEQLETLVRELPEDVRIFLGGRGAPRSVRGITLLPDLDALDTTLQSA